LKGDEWVVHATEVVLLNTRGSDDGALIDEAAAGQIAVVSSQLSVRSITTMCDNDEYDDDNDDGDNDG